MGKTIKGHWDIALRDLDYAIGLDGNNNGQITWGELRARHEAIAAYALARLQISRDDSTCASHHHQTSSGSSQRWRICGLKFFR